MDGYYIEFMQNILALSGTHQNFTESEFTRYLCDILTEHAVIEEYTLAGFKSSSRGLRVDAFHINNEHEILTLIVTDFRFSDKLEVITHSEVTRNFRRASRFFAMSLDNGFVDKMEESSEAFELAFEINKRNKCDKFSKIDLILLTNAKLSDRVHRIESSEVEGYNCEFSIWDIGRLYRMELSGKFREDVEIDFEQFVPGGIPCLPAFTGSKEFASYLTVIPGNVVAALYDKYGERLLEQNVRTFLQFRGKVNKGIRDTLRDEPDKFFAYNNGLTATAEEVLLGEEQKQILKAKNLQIVNGGQTTASIFAAQKKSKVDLTSVYVQAKLTVISPEKVDAFVPLISKYANTQNKVSQADFSSNHPFHLRIEEMSRRLWAPAQAGNQWDTHWFYERARGQYANAQLNFTPSQKKQFLLQNPRSQMFTKTDLAKFEQSYDMKPFQVSLGAQKNFLFFSREIGERWEEDNHQFNELYYKCLIAKAIIFRFLDKNLMRQSWYGGYKINIVTYSVAKLVHLVQKTGRVLDLNKIWREQRLDSALRIQLLNIASVVNGHIQNTPAGIKNVTEWCKKEACWSNLKEMPLELDEDMKEKLIDVSKFDELKKEAVKDQRETNTALALKHVVEMGPDYWQKMSEFGARRELFSDKEFGILRVASDIPNKIPSDKQAKILMDIEKKAKSEGFLVFAER